MNTIITIETTVRADMDAVWNLWNAPEHIEQWMHASEDWECTAAVNDVRVGGRFVFTLAAKDKSVSFDLPGIYTEVVPNKFLAYTLDDERTVSVSFIEIDNGVHISETFEAEQVNSEEMQRGGWQAILDNFKKYAENQQA
ncbi:MAG: polyketide cyclase [Parcubacteria group bacterium]|nr:polyketide cyclase [Parcubacteria group bacterium]